MYPCIMDLYSKPKSLHCINDAQFFFFFFLLTSIRSLSLCCNFLNLNQRSFYLSLLSFPTLLLSLLFTVFLSDCLFSGSAFPPFPSQSFGHMTSMQTNCRVRSKGPQAWTDLIVQLHRVAQLQTKPAVTLHVLWSVNYTKHLVENSRWQILQ